MCRRPENLLPNRYRWLCIYRAQSSVSDMAKILALDAKSAIAATGTSVNIRFSLVRKLTKPRDSKLDLVLFPGYRL